MIRVDVEQGSPEWFAARLGIPTASNFHRLVTPKTAKLSAQAKAYSGELLAEWFLGESGDAHKSQFMQRGSDMEDEAVRWYEFQNDVEVDRVGFCLTDDRRIGCSPDGLIGEDGGLEIKLLSAGNHLIAMLEQNNYEHRCQIQGGLYVTGRRWWDRLYYHPSFPPVVVRMTRDDEFLGTLATVLDRFLEAVDYQKERLLELGCKRIAPKLLGAFCTHRREDGRYCMSHAGLIRTQDGWRCEGHAPSLEKLVEAWANVSVA